MLPTIARRGGSRRCAQRYEDQIEGSLELYGELVAAGIPGEDARFVFPNATRTNLVMTTNLRALIHMSGLRLCTMAQWEIRRLFQLIRHEIFTVSPFLGSFLAPKCVAARLLRRDGQPRRALPDPAAQGQRPRGLGREGEGGPGGRPRAVGPLGRLGAGPAGAASPASALVGAELRRRSGGCTRRRGRGPGRPRPPRGPPRGSAAGRCSRRPGSSRATRRRPRARPSARRSPRATVDIPTASAPSVRSIRTSAGVS